MDANQIRAISGIKNSLGPFVQTMQTIQTVLGRSTDAFASLQTKTPIVKAFHKAEVCTAQNIEALLELDMVLQDLLNEHPAE
jgi:hypothetical protein